MVQSILDGGVRAAEDYACEIVALADQHQVNGECTMNELDTFLKGTQYEEFLQWLKAGFTKKADGKKKGKTNHKRFDVDKSSSLSMEEIAGAISVFLKELQDGALIHLDDLIQKPIDPVAGGDTVVDPSLAGLAGSLRPPPPVGHSGSFHTMNAREVTAVMPRIAIVPQGPSTRAVGRMAYARPSTSSGLTNPPPGALGTAKLPDIPEPANRSKPPATAGGSWLYSNYSTYVHIW